MNCKFTTIAENHHKCDICGFELRIKEDPTKIFRRCKKTNQEFPPLVQQAGEFIHSMIQYAQDGFQNVSKEQYDERLKICGSCEFYVNGSCSKCGCACNFKAQIRAMKCPINKWPEIK